ncbi:hypothetical protein BXY85_2858 [Roseivirga pacifica]|jgi:hypothetical protein|uniref:DUF4177 domain-containing protein n=1 Tax=Roseivirga pacifica TaxID=1267423 RepID=A0A1I0R0F5_9BACT|nr:hypothetical protein [Roseivirga pacifica]RKQ42252.1 hypothetical protein BXY85_2858 [Roseivirga pacifica]SEW33498.1 hypothetical protein SAMN05216290_3014 [Roseivirga pacifica]
MQYKIIQKGPFEKVEKFEKKLNEMAMSGWRIVASLGDFYLVLGKDKH